MEVSLFGPLPVAEMFNGCKKFGVTSTVEFNLGKAFFGVGVPPEIVLFMRRCLAGVGGMRGPSRRFLADAAAWASKWAGMGGFRMVLALSAYRKVLKRPRHEGKAHQVESENITVRDRMLHVMGILAQHTDRLEAAVHGLAAGG